VADEVGLPVELIRELRVIPSYYLRYYYCRDEVLQDQLSGRSRAEEVMEIERRLLEMYRDPKLDEKPKLLEERGGAFYSEAAAQLIASLHSDTGDVQVVNVRTAGRARPPRRRGGRDTGADRPDRGTSAAPGVAPARVARSGPGREGLRGPRPSRRQSTATGQWPRRRSLRTRSSAILGRPAPPRRPPGDKPRVSAAVLRTGDEGGCRCSVTRLERRARPETDPIDPLATARAKKRRFR